MDLSSETLRQLIQGVLPQYDPTPINRAVAVDCEMVGAGFNGSKSILARVSVIDFSGVILFDSFVTPTEPVVDYRTQFSGIRKGDLIGAPLFRQVQTEVKKIFEGTIVIGHSLHYDLEVLKINLPLCQRVDTSNLGKMLPQYQHRRNISLKDLTFALFQLPIQTGEHSSVQDARACMAIYRHLAQPEVRMGTTLSHAEIAYMSQYVPSGFDWGNRQYDY